MGRRVASVALSAAILISALGTAISAETAQQPVPTDTAVQCVSLDADWKTAEAACSTNANLGRARSLAHEGELKCKAAETSQRKIGIGKYQQALRLCRKPDAPN